MLVIKSHKILLDTTPEVEDTFISWCGAARWAYNYGLEQKKKAYEEAGKSLTVYDLMKLVVVLKKTDEYVWLQDVAYSVPRMALIQLGEAYVNFFRRVKRGDKLKGFPKFKSRKTAKTAFHIEAGAIAIKDNRVRIPKLGWLKMHQPIRFEGKIIRSVCISQTAGKWYVSFSIETEVPDPIENQEEIRAVGLDVGIKYLAVLSNGKKFENPKADYRLKNLFARAQRQMERKQRGSNRWKRAKLRVQRIHKRIADLRANATHHVSAYVTSNYSGVAIEDLNVQGMSKNHYLAKSILDANFAELHRQLFYKMNWVGGEVRQVDRFFPSSKICSICGFINDNLTLANREWICKCGAQHDRDVNAAINLVTECYGRGLTVTARGGSGVAKPTNEARTSFEGRTKRDVLHSLQLEQAM